jgi:hypothetical protein
MYRVASTVMVLLVLIVLNVAISVLAVAVAEPGIAEVQLLASAHTPLVFPFHVALAAWVVVLTLKRAAMIAALWIKVPVVRDLLGVFIDGLAYCGVKIVPQVITC